MMEELDRLRYDYAQLMNRHIVICELASEGIELVSLGDIDLLKSWARRMAKAIELEATR